MPGFTSSQARMTRQGAQESSKATLDAQTELAGLVRQGKMAGLGGQVGAGGALGSLESNVAAGRREGTSIISEAERIGIANRLASAGVSQQEIDQLMRLADQKPGLWERIREGLGIGANVIGAIGGV